MNTSTGIIYLWELGNYKYKRARDTNSIIRTVSKQVMVGVSIASNKM